MTLLVIYTSVYNVINSESQQCQVSFGIRIVMLFLIDTVSNLQSFKLKIVKIILLVINKIQFRQGLWHTFNMCEFIKALSFLEIKGRQKTPFEQQTSHFHTFTWMLLLITMANSKG